MDRVVNSPGIEWRNKFVDNREEKNTSPLFSEDVNKFADNREREKKLSTYFMRTIHDPKIKSKNGIK